MRPKGLHYINTPQAFDTVFNIFKSFMKEKMKKRVNIYKNLIKKTFYFNKISNKSSKYKPHEFENYKLLEYY